MSRLSTRTLAVDTSSPVQVIGFCEKIVENIADAGKEAKIFTIEKDFVETIPRGDHSSTLLKNIDAMISTFDFGIRDLDFVVVTSGPGSFTGLRVGLSVAKGLARAAKKCVINTVCSLDFVVRCGIEQEKCADDARKNYTHIYACTDARRREIYYREYRTDELFSPNGAAATLSPRDFIQKLQEDAARGERSLVCGTAENAYPEIGGIPRYQPPGEDPTGDQPLYTYIPTKLDPQVLIRLGQEKYDKVGGENIYHLEPNYVRPSDAKVGKGPLIKIAEE